VVSPFFNEAAIIGAAVRRMIGNLRSQFGQSWELILVDDGSEDASLEKVRLALTAEPSARVRVISYTHNQGRGRALKTGINEARGQIIVTTEADCSWGDDVVARLVAEMDAHPECDFVIASPHRPGGGLVNVPPFRRFLTRTGNWIIRQFFDSTITMNTGMTRAYRRNVIRPLVVHENGKEFHLEVLLKLLTLGFHVREIPATITWPDHRANKTAARKSSTKLGQTISSHLRFIAIAQPVRYFGWLALFALVLGSGFMAAAFWALLTQHVPAVFLALVGLIMLLFCLLFTGFSVLFFQLREAMREDWLRSYPDPLPPSARPGVVLHSQGGA